ncbi:MAG: hypothetical protein JXM79_22545 [Sedimentisphaerales bacterium]|nr:hypothetical protein [Sedimentisphaerales bacterium]
MTRRIFVRRFVKSCAFVLAGVFGLIRSGSARKPKKRKFTWAFRLHRYPGPVKPLRDINEQSKWSG